MRRKGRSTEAMKQWCYPHHYTSSEFSPEYTNWDGWIEQAEREQKETERQRTRETERKSGGVCRQCSRWQHRTNELDVSRHHPNQSLLLGLITCDTEDLRKQSLHDWVVLKRPRSPAMAQSSKVCFPAFIIFPVGKEKLWVDIQVSCKDD